MMFRSASLVSVLPSESATLIPLSVSEATMLDQGLQKRDASNLPLSITTLRSKFRSPSWTQFNMQSTRPEQKVLVPPLNIPNPRSSARPSHVVLVPRSIPGRRNRALSVPFEVLGLLPNGQGWQKAPYVKDLLQGRVQLVQSEERVWRTRQMYSDTILWELDWPGFYGPVPVDEPSKQRTSGEPVTRHSIALSICYVLEEASRAQPWPALQRSFEQSFTTEYDERLYTLKTVDLGRIRLESLDCVYDTRGVKRWFPKFYVDRNFTMTTQSA